jgi:hypothetical protein
MRFGKVNVRVHRKSTVSMTVDRHRRRHAGTLRGSSVLVAVWLALAAPVSAQNNEPRPIGAIDFFGMLGVDVGGVRAALPLHEGDVLAADSDDPRARVAAAVRQAIGRDPTDVAIVCCDERQQWLLFIGLPGTSSKPMTYQSAPTSSIRLPTAVITLDDELIHALMAAVAVGDAGEDDSQGFALSSNAALRSKQLALRDYAVGHEPLLLRVVEQSSDARHRAIAAAALGYANASKAQVSALTAASFDPNESVRNNAVRALAVLLGARPELARAINARRFVGLLTSNTWTDRNKGTMLFVAMTRTRDKRLLQMLRADAFDALVEMARWRSSGHAASARVLLGRVAGIEEQHLQQLLDDGRADEILAAASRRAR